MTVTLILLGVALIAFVCVYLDYEKAEPETSLTHQSNNLLTFSPAHFITLSPAHFLSS